MLKKVIFSIIIYGVPGITPETGEGETGEGEAGEGETGEGEAGEGEAGEGETGEGEAGEGETGEGEAGEGETGEGEAGEGETGEGEAGEGEAGEGESGEGEAGEGEGGTGEGEGEGEIPPPGGDESEGEILPPGGGGGDTSPVLQYIRVNSTHSAQGHTDFFPHVDPAYHVFLLPDEIEPAQRHLINAAGLGGPVEYNSQLQRWVSAPLPITITLEAFFDDPVTDPEFGEWEVIGPPSTISSLQGPNLVLETPSSGGTWKVRYNYPNAEDITTFYIVLPLAGAEMKSTIREDMSAIAAFSDALELIFLPRGVQVQPYMAQCFWLFYVCGNGDFLGLPQPFVSRVMPGVTYPPGVPVPVPPDDMFRTGSVFEVNAPRTLLGDNDKAIDNSIVTWFGLKADTATLNYFYPAHALGLRAKGNPRYEDAADWVRDEALSRGGGNSEAKRLAYLLGRTVSSQEDYDFFAPDTARLIYAANDSIIGEWISAMVPNAGIPVNQLSRGIHLAEGYAFYGFFSSPGFIDLKEEYFFVGPTTEGFRRPCGEGNENGASEYYR